MMHALKPGNGSNQPRAAAAATGDAAADRGGRETRAPLTLGAMRVGEGGDALPCEGMEKRLEAC